MALALLDLSAYWRHRNDTNFQEQGVT